VISGYLHRIGLKSSLDVGRGNTAYESTTSGAYAFDGKVETPSKWKLSIITR
jgi:hypothetical protein